MPRDVRAAVICCCHPLVPPFLDSDWQRQVEPLKPSDPGKSLGRPSALRWQSPGGLGVQDPEDNDCVPRDWGLKNGSKSRPSLDVRSSWTLLPQTMSFICG